MLFYFVYLPINANARLYKLDHPTTPHARLALTCEGGDIRRIPGGIDHSDDRAGETGSEPRLDGAWVFFCAGAKPKSRTAAIPAFPSGVWSGWENGRPLRCVACALEAVVLVGVPSATCCDCCKVSDKNVEGVTM